MYIGAFSDRTKACGGTDSGRSCMEMRSIWENGTVLCREGIRRCWRKHPVQALSQSQRQKMGEMCCGRGKGSWICERRYDRVFTGAKLETFILWK